MVAVQGAVMLRKKPSGYRQVVDKCPLKTTPAICFAVAAELLLALEWKKYLDDHLPIIITFRYFCLHIILEWNIHLKCLQCIHNFNMASSIILMQVCMWPWCCLSLSVLQKHKLSSRFQQHSYDSLPRSDVTSWSKPCSFSAFESEIWPFSGVQWFY